MRLACVKFGFVYINIVENTFNVDLHIIISSLLAYFGNMKVGFPCTV